MQGNPGDKAKQSLSQASKMFSQSNFAKHIVAGTASGWLTGAIFRHTGKNLALIAGSGIIIYEVAHYNGYIKQDWGSIKEMAQKKTNQLTQSTPAINKMRAFAIKNRAFTAGFVGGFLIGVAI